MICEKDKRKRIPSLVAAANVYRKKSKLKTTNKKKKETKQSYLKKLVNMLGAQTKMGRIEPSQINNIVSSQNV